MTTGLGRTTDPRATRPATRPATQSATRTAEPLPAETTAPLRVYQSGPPGPDPALPPSGEPAPGGPRQRRGGLRTRLAAHRATAAALLCFTVGQLAVLRVLDLLQPRFFLDEGNRLVWYSDVQAQFLPVMWWLGRTRQGLSPTLLDPDVGGNGNFTADMQYGALDPLHWVLHDVLARFQDFVPFSWCLAVGTLTATGLALVLVVRRAGVPVLLSAAAALGATTSGFLMFFGSDWWPVLVTVPFFCWLWYGLLRRDLLGAVLVGVGTGGVLVGGNIYLAPFAALLIAAVLGQQVVRTSFREAVRLRWVQGYLVAAVGGVLTAAPTLLAVVGAGSQAIRPHDPSVLGNTGFGVPNVLDVLLGGASTHAVMNDWVGTVEPTPAFFTFVLAVPLLVLVDWRRAVRHPLVPPALVLVVASVLATQLPAVVGVLRIPFRCVLVLHLVLPVLAAVAHTVAPVRTRRRFLIAAAVVLAQTALAVCRAPALGSWHLLTAVLAGTALAALWWYGREQRPVAGRRPTHHRVTAVLAGGLVLVIAGSQVLVGFGQEVHIHDVLEAQQPTQNRFQGTGYDLGTTVGGYRDRALAPDAAVTVLQYDTIDQPSDVRAAGGVLYGDANLVAGMRTGFGYSAVQHAGSLGLECDGLQPCRRLVKRPPVGGDTSLLWVDLVAADDLFVSTAAPATLVSHLRSSPLWTPLADVRGYFAFRRSTALTGRVTWTSGVAVDPTGWTSTLARLGQDQERYRVSTGAVAGRVVLRVPYWPGYRAEVGGRAVPVRAFGGSLVEVDVPAGVAHAELTLRYAPAAVRLFWPLWIGGVLLVLLGAARAFRAR